MTRLCTKDDVDQYIDTTGAWTLTEVNSAIDFIENEIYDECNVIKSMYSTIDSDYAEYYLGERFIYRIDNIRYGDIGSEVQLTATTHYTKYLDKGLVVLSTTAINSLSSVSWPEDYIEVEYVPKIYNKYCAARTAQHLLERTQVVSGDSAERSLAVINKRVETLRTQIMNKIGIVLSGDNKNYDYEYDIARKKIVQDHDRNKDLLRNN